MSFNSPLTELFSDVMLEPWLVIEFSVAVTRLARFVSAELSALLASVPLILVMLLLSEVIELPWLVILPSADVTRVSREDKALAVASLAAIASASSID